MCVCVCVCVSLSLSLSLSSLSLSLAHSVAHLCVLYYTNILRHAGRSYQCKWRSYHVKHRREQERSCTSLFHISWNSWLILYSWQVLFSVFIVLTDTVQDCQQNPDCVKFIFISDVVGMQRRSKSWAYVYCYMHVLMYVYFWSVTDMFGTRSHVNLYTGVRG